jgi:hypothetical protein
MFDQLSSCLYDATLVSWKEKVAVDAVRPISAVRGLMSGTKVAAWAGPGKGTRTIDAG